MPRRVAGDISDMRNGNARQRQNVTEHAGGIARNPSVRLTGRGGVLVVFALSLAGASAASVSNVGVLAGLSYVGACVFATAAVRRSQLLPVVVTPPMLFGGAVVCVQAITADGGMLATAEGTLVTLGNVAPWLFAGTALGTFIALARGLTGNVRAMRDALRGDSPDRGRLSRDDTA
jgi:hypothetical protein